MVSYEITSETLAHYEKPMYSRSRIDKAGKVISKSSDDSDAFMQFIPVVDNWRAAHAYPLDIIRNIITNSIADDIMIVQRLKRRDSIIAKLQRPNNSGLYRMQDLGGCRIIVADVKSLYETVGIIKSILIKHGHRIYKEYDYLNEPRTISGYRSYHIVVQYTGETNDPYNNMFIEIQVRTKLEHSWATAVEIIDFITKNTLKAGTGSESYMRFFKLVSALFAINEGTSIVVGVPQCKEEIVQELYTIDNRHRIRDKLSAYNSAIKFTGNYPQEAEYHLLITDLANQTINCISYRKGDIEKATKRYQSLESTKTKHSIDVVLVAANDFDTIRECYPNYFAETRQFLINISRFCADCPERSTVKLNLESKSTLLSNFFDIKKIPQNISRENMRKISTGIGTPSGNFSLFPSYPISLEESYLRFSAVKVLIEEKSFTYLDDINSINGPAIFVSISGSSFIVEESLSSIICDRPGVVITCKEKVDEDKLYCLLGWLKSNLCTWNLVWNQHKQSAYYATLRDTCMIPDLDLESSKCVSANVKAILKKEEHFVNEYTASIDNPEINNQGFIDQFNRSVLPELQCIEQCFMKNYCVSDKEKESIKNEIELKGYFSYY